MTTLWIGLGGALGSIVRHWLATFVQERAGMALPYGTIAVNLFGSFLAAALMHVAFTTELVPPAVRLGLMTGVLGGFTTYSAFNYETLRFLQSGAWGPALMNAAATVFGCLVAGFCGWAAARAVVGA
jgi:CrcB protein